MSGDDFLRDAVSRAGDGFDGGVPNDLAGTLEARRTRIVRRRTATRVLAGAAVIVLVGALALQFGSDDEDAVETVDVPEATSTTVAPTTATTVPATETTVPTDTTTVRPTTTTQPTTTTVPAPSVTPIGASDPISLYGVGAVRAGMTIAEAEAATGQAFTIDGFDFAEGSCYFARVDGIDDLLFLVTSDAGPTGDPRQGVLGRVTLSTPGRTTISGVGIGATHAEVIEAYGDRLAETPHMYVPDGSYLDYTSPDPADSGYMVRFEIADGVVRDIHAGQAREAAYVEGCA